MEQFTSSEVKQNFGKVSDKALQGPVSITSHGRPSLVLTSDEDYKELMRLRYEALRTDVQSGFESLERGEGAVLKSREELHVFMEDVKRRGREKLAKELG